MSPRRLPPPARLAGWGRMFLPGHEELSDELERATRGARLSRGLGRSYGDASLPAHPDDRIVGTRLADRILAWDERTGILRAEAGLSLDAILRWSMPRGWTLPVTPGTRMVTLGGMVASDVHGKSHHVHGTFGAHVTGLRLRLANDDVVEMGPDENADLFWATVGGMGLTGHILEVETRLHRIPSSWVMGESVRVGNIGEFLSALAEAAPVWPMTAGWIDCLASGRGLGRGYLTMGRWAMPAEAPAEAPRWARTRRIAVEFPDWALNRVTSAAFNTAIYWTHWRRRKVGLFHPEPFFWPLDVLADWNLGYGQRGFTQYQCVIPRAAGTEGVTSFLRLVVREGGASPLCVIKDCGPEGQGILSFPLEGTSVAIDMAVTPQTPRIVAALNEFVIETGGRIYLTKDAFTTRADFARMEPRLPRFQEIRERWDPGRRLRSALSVRVLGDSI